MCVAAVLERQEWLVGVVGWAGSGGRRARRRCGVARGRGAGGIEGDGQDRTLDQEYGKKSQVKQKWLADETHNLE